MMQNYTPIAMPSIDQLFNQMKGLDPSQLSKYIQDPDPNKKLAAMAALNSDKQMQQAAAAQQGPMPTVAQKLAQGVSQAPTMPTPGMPAVPAQAQAKPAGQGIAALQPTQTPPGSAMGILPPQSAPAPQGNPQGMPVGKAAGGIASFASGGQAQQTAKQQAQIAQQLAQLMQGINQDATAQVPKQADQVGIAAPQPGQANPMQNYASMVFATRPQFRPGTEAAPISQDLSLSQMGQYSSAQPIAAAHGGLMHHVPDHMYKFAHGGILGFKDAGVVPQAQADQADMDASSNPPLRYQSVVDAAHEALQRKGNIYTGQKPTNEQNAAWYNNAPTSPADIQAARVAAWGARQAQPAPTPVAAPSAPVDPATAAVLSAMPANMPDSFPGSKTDYLNQRQMALNSVAANNQQQPSALAVGQTSAANTPAIPSPLQLTPTGAGGGQGNRGIAGSIPTAPSTNAPAPTTNVVASGVPTAAPSTGIKSVLRPGKVATPTEEEKANPPSSKAVSLVDEANKKILDETQKKLTLSEIIDESSEAAKKLGINTDAGAAMLERAMKAHEEYKRTDDSLERFQRIMSAIAHGGLAGGGSEAANYSAEKRAQDMAESRQFMKDLEEAEGKTREEKLGILKKAQETKAKQEEIRASTASSRYGHELTNETQRQDALLRETGANRRAELERGTQLAIAKLQREASLLGKETTANDIAEQLKSDPKYKDASYAERMRTAFNIKSGLGDKMTSADILARMKMENANMNNLTLGEEDRSTAKERYNMLSDQLDKITGMAGSATISTPTVDEFVAKAAPLNPKMSKEQLIAKYKELYGAK